MTSRRTPGLLALLIGVCLVLGAAGLVVVRPASDASQIALDTQPGPPAETPTTGAAAPTTVAPTTAPAPAAAAAPTTKAPGAPAPKRTTTTRAPAAVPQAVAPGVAFTTPVLPSSPQTPASSPVPPAATGDGISTAPLLPGTTTTTSAGTGKFAFLDTWGNGKPARWNPCTPIHYAVNVTGAPQGALTLVQQAVARLASATGASFVFDGTTSEVPDSSWGFGPSTSFPTGWQPLLIGFPTDAQSDLLDGENAGAAFPVTVEFSSTGELVDVSGAVAVDGDLADILPMTFGGASVGSILLHELAHALGLGHVEDQSEIMNPTIGAWTPNTWGKGDAEGLRQLGADSGCTRTVPAPPWG